jgi:Saxitoxin biosynthesis operon protein SxtJ
LETRVPARLSTAEGRRFALVVGTAFAVLGGILYWRGFFPGSVVAWGLGGLLILAGLLVPGRLGPVYRGWMQLALVISRVTTPIFMGLVFYLVMTPVGLIMRLVGHRPLVSSGPTAWVTRPDASRRSDLQRQF